MRPKTFKEFVYGTIQGLILIAVSYVGSVFVYKKMIKNMFKIEEV